MITLAIAELVHALAPHLKGLFGGEAGVSSTRMPALGITFGSTNEVYYLTLAWVLLCLALLYLYTRTPLGRLTLGLRENTHRLRFLGYNTHRLSICVFTVSAIFSGIAGGLQVVCNEAANYVRVRCATLRDGRAEHLHRRGQSLLRAGPRGSLDDLLRLCRLGSDAILAALPGQPCSSWS